MKVSRETNTIRLTQPIKKKIVKKLIKKPSTCRYLNDHKSTHLGKSMIINVKDQNSTFFVGK